MASDFDMHGIYREAFEDEPRDVKITYAPGRVNIIGEHTDYNDGFVLPMPIDRHIWIAAKPRGDYEVHLYAADYDERASFDLGDIQFDREHMWANYVMGVADAMKKRGYQLKGANITIKGDIPQGAGLGSSAAIEIAVIRAFIGLFDLEIDPLTMAYMGKSAENDFVGVQSGIMDQFVSSLGRRGHALLIDCRTNEYEHLSLPHDFRVVVVNTMVKRGLVSSAYNERRRQCEQGVRLLKMRLPHIEALRDVSSEDFERFQGDLPVVVRKRCRHVIDENNRVLEAVKSIRLGNMGRLGEFMYESHASLRDGYEVSCRELDILVEAARTISGTVGARMTGAGFGGCTVNIVRKERVDSFEQAIKERYRAATDLEAEVYNV